MPLTLEIINRKGKFLWFEFIKKDAKNKFYLMNTLGMDGRWHLNKSDNVNVEILFEDKKKR